MANLAVGFKYFLAFVQEVGAVDQDQAEKLWQRCCGALGDAAAAQQEQQADSDPVNRFLELLGAAISSGRAHLSDGKGEAPKLATAWGWREVGAGDYTRMDLRPLGERVGWLDGGEIYLQADAAYAVVQRLARDEGDNIPVTLPTLKKRLNERGLLASTEKHRAGGREVERLEVRKVLQGKRRSVLHFNSTSLAPTPSESEPCEPCQPSAKGSYLFQRDDGSRNGSQIWDSTGKVSHESEPRAAVVVSEEGDNGSHGSQNIGDD